MARYRILPTPAPLSASSRLSRKALGSSRCSDDTGAATAEYAIALVAAAGFAGVLVTLLTSDTARSWLNNLIQGALAL
ncbi:MAG: DUF4244 domain-containing protein [Bifidobacteriaceae bacterium]|jgi:hypothetical protein|nr:DUF4244 domain-containing protein [Bifidobacteriaceae bacterium]